MTPRLTLITAQNMASANIMYPVIRELQGQIANVILLNSFPLSNGKEIRAFTKLLRRCALSFLVFKFLEVWVHGIIARCRRETIEQLCRRHGIPVQSFASADDPDFLALLTRNPPDYLVSTGPAILRAPVIATARKAVLNCHGARLPQYRGPANYIWTLMNGDTTRWATIHRLVEKVDAGPVWREASFPIDPRWSVYEYNYHHAFDCGKLLAGTLRDLIGGKQISEIPQDESLAVTRTFPGGGDMAQFRKRGIPLWRLSDLWRCSKLPSDH